MNGSSMLCSILICSRLVSDMVQNCIDDDDDRQKRTDNPFAGTRMYKRRRTCAVQYMHTVEQIQCVAIDYVGRADSHPHLGAMMDGPVFCCP
jgi:hypothetical protein